MWNNTGFGSMLSMSLMPVTLILMLWSLFWKGLALWHAARREMSWWFLIMLVINTFGLLEIYFLFGQLKLTQKDLFPKMK